MSRLWRTIAVVAGAIMLVGAGFLAGMLVYSHPAPAGPAVAAAPEAAGGGEAGAEDEKQQKKEMKTASKTIAKVGGKKGKAAAKVVGMMPTSALKLLNSRSNMVTNRAAESAADTVGEASTPGIQVAGSALQGALPPFLAKQVPWLTSYANYTVKARTREAVENAAEAPGEQLNKAAWGAGREGAGEDEEGAASGDGEGGVAAAPAAPAPPGEGSAAPAEIESTAWTIELGRFASRRNAEDFAADMTRQGVETHLIVENVNDRYWYSVRTGSFDSNAEASGDLERMRKMGLDGTVVSEAGGEGG